MTASKLKEATQAFEKAEAQLRAYVEPPFHVVRNLFKHRKVRDRSLAKNTAQLAHPGSVYADVEVRVNRRDVRG